MFENPTNGPILLRGVDLHKSYYRGSEIPVLRGVDLEIHEGEFATIVGSSGSGKSTLLHVLGGLDQPTAGEIHWEGERIDDQPASVGDRYRNEMVGFVFQFYHLLPELTALENVLVPAMIRYSVPRYFSERPRLTRRAKELLARVGLSHRIKHRPTEMSGGELQRAAIARALLVEPRLLLADEPTGNLDAETGEEVMSLLRELRAEANLTVLMVTHDRDLANRSDRILHLVNGRLDAPRLRHGISTAAG